MRRLKFETLEDRRVCALVFGDGAANRELAKDFPFVGWVEDSDAGRVEFNGSCVLIAPHWVLMSAHQALKVDNDRSTIYDSFRVGFGSSVFTDRGENQVASEIYINPTYTDVAKGFDLALLYFKESFKTVTPVTKYSGQIALGDDVSIVGFGNLQDVNDPTNVQILTGDRYAGNNAIDRLTDPLRPSYLRTGIYRNTLDPYHREHQMGGRPGDSGGALVKQGGLAGITVRAVGDSLFGITQYSRLDNDWIDSVMATKAKKWQNEASPLDVNADGSVTAFDALLIINFLNTNPGDPPAFQQPYLDVTGDDAITAIDALYVINALNLQVTGEGEANDSFFADDIELNRLMKLQSLSIRPRLVQLR